MVWMLPLMLAAQAGAFTLTLPVSPETPEGQRLIAERAIRACSGRYAQLGHYTFVGNERVLNRDGSSVDPSPRFAIHQEYICLDAPPPPAQGAPVAADWQPSPADENEVATQTQHYFDLIDAADAQGVLAMMTELNRAGMDLQERQAQMNAFRRDAGAPGERRIIHTTWYVNPDGAPVPGVYVAIDFERSFSRMLVYCGYIVLYRGGDGHYRLAREDIGQVPQPTPGSSPLPLAQARQMAQCRD